LHQGLRSITSKAVEEREKVVLHMAEAGVNGALCVLIIALVN
jgi:hypothetical protein